MLIYHNHNSSIDWNAFNKKKKKDYKNVDIRKPLTICTRVLKQEGRKNSKVKKKLSKKNAQFLKSIGHKVKQPQHK